MNNNQDEQQHFDDTRTVIQANIAIFEAEYERRKQETLGIFQAIQNGDAELYDQMAASKSLEEHSENQLRKNRLALLRPYFGRIDFTDLEIEKEECLYIGKNGIFKNHAEIVVVDWRAPVSSIYYENELGNGTYLLPEPKGKDSQAADIHLHLKRTYDVADGQLKGYYDSDVSANDALLVQYLSMNREAVLGEIIATIQKEQNAIIRESPFANLIVQGVAGSGKTTVAIHRMSYLLYNYKERFEANEFCVVGSNDLLLDYITGGLPELDVSRTKKMRMDELFMHLLRKEWKSKYRLVSDYPDAVNRSNLAFIKELEQFLAAKKAAIFNGEAVFDHEIGMLLTESSKLALFHEQKEYSVYRLMKTMDERIVLRIQSFTGQIDALLLSKKRKAYRSFHLSQFPKITVLGLYQEFMESKSSSIKSGCFDIYDVAAMVLIYYRIFQKVPDAEFGLLFIDEAQDFGSALYYVLKQVLPSCYFTIMGDVSQNINYESGMNDWEEIRSFFLTAPKDQFKVLAKSYRNTIEISEYAGKILEKASDGQYKITPVIRHGAAVLEEVFWSTGEMAERIHKLISQIKSRGFQTVAVICHDEAEVKIVRKLLSSESEDYEKADQTVMILPVRLTKGLEFDAVILWNPMEIGKLKSPKEAKLLYVAATRALHELYVLRC